MSMVRGKDRRVNGVKCTTNISEHVSETVTLIRIQSFIPLAGAKASSHPQRQHTISRQSGEHSYTYRTIKRSYTSYSRFGFVTGHTLSQHVLSQRTNSCLLSVEAARWFNTQALWVLPLEIVAKSSSLSALDRRNPDLDVLPWPLSVDNPVDFELTIDETLSESGER